MEVLVIPEFITRAERNHLISRARRWRKSGVLQPNPKGPHRYAAMIYRTHHVDTRIQAIHARIVEALQLAGMPTDPYLGWVCSMIEPGGFIHPHVDRYKLYQQTPNRHLRCNVLVQRGDDSADPIIADNPRPVPERGLWAFFASELIHGTGKIRTKPRIVYQYGFVAPPTYSLRNVV